MATQGDRQEFLWRPNDNSVTTRTRYDLEAEHWYKSFKSAEMKHKKVSLGETLDVIGLVISLIGSLLALILMCFINVIKYFNKNLSS
ncbi:hypothetical protein [Psychroserpens sp.]